MNRKLKVNLNLLAAAIVALTFSATALAEGLARQSSPLGFPEHAGIQQYSTSRRSRITGAG